MNAGLFGPAGPDLWIRIRGRTVGAIVCAGFGAYSAYWIVGTRAAREAWLCIIVAVTAALVAWSVVQLRAMRGAPRPILSRRLVISYNVWFFALVAAEVAGIVLGRPILNYLHRSDLYANWVDGVVGIHFLPLGRLFKLPIYYATGGAISFAALGSLLISESSWRLGVCAGGTGLALWLTGALILYGNRSTLPATSSPRET